MNHDNHKPAVPDPKSGAWGGLLLTYWRASRYPVRIKGKAFLAGGATGFCIAAILLHSWILVWLAACWAIYAYLL